MPLVQHKVFTENLAAATEHWCWHVVLLFFLLCFKNFSVFLQLYIELYIEREKRKKNVKNQIKELHFTVLLEDCLVKGETNYPRHTVLENKKWLVQFQACPILSND